MSPALAGGFLATVSPGKFLKRVFLVLFCLLLFLYNFLFCFGNVFFFFFGLENFIHLFFYFLEANYFAILYWFKEMATHSSTLAWRIPWMEELGGLKSMGRKESDTTERLHFTSLAIH